MSLKRLSSLKDKIGGKRGKPSLKDKLGNLATKTATKVAEVKSKKT